MKHLKMAVAAIGIDKRYWVSIAYNIPNLNILSSVIVYFNFYRYDAKVVIISGFELVLQCWPLPWVWACFYQDSANVSIVF